MKIGNSSAYCSSQIIRSARFVMLFAALAFGSLNVNASSVPMLFDFVEESLTGTFSYDDANPITFEGFPGITAYDLDSLLVNHSKFGTQASWSLAEQVFSPIRNLCYNYRPLL